MRGVGLTSLSIFWSEIMEGVHFPAIEKAGEVLYIYFLFYIEYYVILYGSRYVKKQI